MAARLTWNGGRAETALRRRVKKNMRTASVFLAGQVQRSINRGNADGQNPSKPGEPPKKQSGRLFQSITQEVQERAASIRGVVGTNVVYARRLELGFFGVDSAGRNISQAPRPFLRPALEDNAGAVNKILARP